MPSVSPFAKPGTVCTLTFVASNAHSLQHHVRSQRCKQRETAGLCPLLTPSTAQQPPATPIRCTTAHATNPPNVSKELCRGRARQEDERLVFGCSLGACHDCVLAASIQHGTSSNVFKCHSVCWSACAWKLVSDDATRPQAAPRLVLATYCLKYSYRPADRSCSC
jgi:hypothetical protein